MRQRLNGAWLSLSLGLLSSNPLWPKLWLQRQKLFNPEQNDPAYVDTLQQLLHQVAIGRSQQLIDGVRAYQSHAAQRDPEAMAKPVLWEQGTTRLLDYGAATPDAVPVLVVPSLINRLDILDLDSDLSLMRALAARGLRPLVVDWGLPDKDERHLSIGGYIVERLLPIMDFMKSQQMPVPHVMGYCMGGLLALALAVLRPEQTRSLTLLATPWHTGATTVDEGGTVRRSFMAKGDEFLAMLEKLEMPLSRLDYLPVSFLQFLFACVQPSNALRKFVRFSKMEQDSVKARHFVLTEDWLNDGVPLTAPVARELLGAIYGENATGKMFWHVDGKVIDPRQISLPTYIVVPGKDRIVPPEAALPLARLIRGSVLHEPMAGHIGLLASESAPKTVWAPLMSWLLQH